ncbi:MAG: DUF3857 domain-containing protein [Chrysiogenales bacterium]
MKRFFVFFIILLSAAALLISLPATDARFLNLEITYHLQSDGSWDMEYRHQVRLDTYYAVNRALGETFIVTNPDFQKLEILKAETTMVDGRKVAVPANAFNEVLPFAAHGFADFARLREMVVTHTGLERGALVDLHYRIHTKAGFLPVFSGRELLNRDFPIDQFKLTVAVPAGQELRYRVFGSKAEAEISGTETEKRYAFALAAVKAAAHEPLASGQAAAFVVFSNAADWGQALAMAGDSSLLPTALVDKVERLKAQNPSWPDLLAAVQKIAAAEVQNCNLGPETVGWQTRRLELVVQSNFGTKLEKALMLQSIMQKAGFESELLAVAVGADFAPDVPTSLQIGEYWLKVVDKDGVAYLDPCHEQHEFSPYRCQGFTSFNLKRKLLETLPVSDWEQNGVEISGTVSLEPAGVSGNLTVAVRGIFNRYTEAAENNTKFVEGLLKKIFPVEKAEIKKLLLLSRHEFRAEVTFSGKWLKDIGAGFFSLDACRLPGLPENIIQLSTRETPLLLDAPFKISLDLDLQPTAGLSLDYSAVNVNLANEVGYFSRSHNLEKNGHIRFSETCGILNTPVRAEFYPRLRELLKAYFIPDFWLVLKKGK